ncbi:hypothetical protein, partial [Halorussus salinus]|uniref:hypothetical protein n=1 Tax=Halorussus salinus TaxID=1364935 RepID=UPI00192FB345
MLAVRALHVLAMALVLGGATLTWWLFRRIDPAVAADSGRDTDSGSDADSDSAPDSTAPPATETAVSVAAAYERGFWAALGVLVMTGVGNLGTLAPYVPAAGTRWGTVFAAKLALVVAVLALSVVRTLLVVGGGGGGGGGGATAPEAPRARPRPG